ncbi:Gfo/Idh/MocA family protein [Luteitalea sp. TBR-22]|uniref:Gfo/Idh/MocA family protein n=1 Tax=Luteitalea sp. TBR-22 TaxID=2802971 RepID=UPI001EF425A9|nr:Gfo/Idh/MocA family oxidoreductase [Luteitalea sp. TBR-22]
MRRRPRVGALGAGWIGRHRLETLVAADLVDLVAVADPVTEAASEAAGLAPGAVALEDLDGLLGLDLDGLVVATPTALHATQSALALRAGLAVCCQKPLARSGDEAEAVVAAARRANRLLLVDFSYRYTDAARVVRDEFQAGAIGTLVAATLTFHNAYGPDKAWYGTRDLAGGGCLMDLGVHLLDLLTWITGAGVTRVSSSVLFAQGRRWHDPTLVEDHAQCAFDLEGGASATLGCSWWLPAGCDAVMEVALYGTRGGLRMCNVAGSFHDFVAERLDGTRTHVVSAPPDA